MTYSEFIDRVIDTGKDGASKSYTRPDQKEKLRGSHAGFEACRGKSPAELIGLMLTAEASANEEREQTWPKEEHSRVDRDEMARTYWWYRCYAAEVEWVCNCVSVMLHLAELPPLVNPTARAFLHVASIVNPKALAEVRQSLGIMPAEERTPHGEENPGHTAGT